MRNKILQGSTEWSSTRKKKENNRTTLEYSVSRILVSFKSPSSKKLIEPMGGILISLKTDVMLSSASLDKWQDLRFPEKN